MIANPEPQTQPIQPMQTQAAIAAPVSTARVQEWLAGYLGGCAKRASEHCKQDLWDCVDASDRAYGINKKTIDAQDAGIKAASCDITYEVKTEDLADQVDEMTALIHNMLKSGQIRRLVAKPGITDKQAELTQLLQDSLLNEKGWDETLRTLAGRFIKHPCAGLKVCRSHEVSYITERVEVPVRGMYDDVSLFNRGFDIEDIKDGNAVRSACSEDGLNFVGIADMREDGTYDNLLCTKCKETTEDYVYISALDMRRVAVSDLTRRCNEQHSIHEYHYLTLNEMGKGYYRNLKQLKEKGRAIKSTNEQNPKSSGQTSITNGSLADTPVYQIVESWAEVPWADPINEGKFSEEELRAFAIEWGFAVNEYQYPTAKWCGWHADGILLKIYPSYLSNKSDFPYDVDSFITGDGRFRGQGMMERLSNVTANKSAFLNMTARCMKKMLYQPMAALSTLELSDDAIRSLQKEGGFVRIDGQININDALQTLLVPDVTNAGFAGVSYFDQSIRGLGVPAVLAGEGNADTATQESINNRRGQTIVNDALYRLVGILKSSMTKHLGVAANSFTTARAIETLGEDGATMTRVFATPRDITDKLEFVTMVSFDDADRQRQAQFLMGIANIAAGARPDMLPKIIEMAMRKSGISEADIEDLNSSRGSLTNVYQEIQAMVQDPQLSPEIRMDDPHQLCIQLAMTEIQKQSVRAQQLGIQPQSFDNIIEYIQVHEGMLQQQMLMAQMQMMEQGGAPPEAKGKPVQGRADGGPGDEQGAARQDGQAVGQGNKGMGAMSGMTGQGSPAALVPGVPSGT